jgi:hypothetical protein
MDHSQRSCGCPRTRCYYNVLRSQKMQNLRDVMIEGHFIPESEGFSQLRLCPQIAKHDAPVMDIIQRIPIPHQ